MKQITVSVAEATLEQLREHATIGMGLEVDGRATRQSILAKMHAAGFKSDTITVLVAEDDVLPASVDSPVQRDEHGSFIMRGNRKFRQIMIAVSEQPGGREPVSVSVNGRAMFIPRGERCWVRDAYVEVLRNAVAEVYDPYDPEIDGGRGGLRAPRKVPAYAFSVF